MTTFLPEQSTQWPLTSPVSEQPSSEAPLTALVGSVPGREHVRLGRNNQDAWAVHRRSQSWSAVVADGCSAGRHSEVGAWLAAEKLVAWLVSDEAIELAGDGPALACRAGQVVVDLLAALVGLQTGERTAASVIQEQCLFTILAALVTDRHAVVFGVGDGLYSVNGETVCLDPGPDNAPDYLGYALLDAATVSRTVLPRVHWMGASNDVQSLVLASDGAVELCQRAQEPLKDGSCVGGIAPFEGLATYVRNPTLVQKRLNVIACVNGRLFDDTTVVVLRRKEC